MGGSTKAAGVADTAFGSERVVSQSRGGVRSGACLLALGLSASVRGRGIPSPVVGRGGLGGRGGDRWGHVSLGLRSGGKRGGGEDDGKDVGQEDVRQDVR